MRVFSLFLTPFLLIGCTTSGPKFTQAEQRTGLATIYVNRAKISCGSFDPIFIQVNGHEIGKLYNHGYSFALVKPGEYLVTASMTSAHGPSGGSPVSAVPDGEGNVIIVPGTPGKNLPFSERKFAGVRKVTAKEEQPTYVKYDMDCPSGILPKIQPDKDLQIVSKETAEIEIKETSLGAIKK